MIGSLLTRPAEPGIDQPGVARRRTRLLLVVAAALVAAAGLGSSASLHFPEVLLDHRSFGTALVRTGGPAGVVSLLGLAAFGAVLVGVSRALASMAPAATPGRRVALGCGRTHAALRCKITKR